MVVTPGSDSLALPDKFWSLNQLKRQCVSYLTSSVTLEASNAPENSTSEARLRALRLDSGLLPGAYGVLSSIFEVRGAVGCVLVLLWALFELSVGEESDSDFALPSQPQLLSPPCSLPPHVCVPVLARKGLLPACVECVCAPVCVRACECDFAHAYSEAGAHCCLCMCVCVRGIQC